VKFRLRSEVGRLTSQVDEAKDGVKVVRESLKSTNQDLGIMSTSFTDFIAHFDNYSISVSSNFTTITNEMLTTITSINGLNKRLSSLTSESQSSMKNLSMTLSTVSSHMNGIEAGLGQYKNFTLQVKTTEVDLRVYQLVNIPDTNILCCGR
jgi:hypothetical protein